MNVVVNQLAALVGKVQNTRTTEKKHLPRSGHSFHPITAGQGTKPKHTASGKNTSHSEAEAVIPFHAESTNSFDDFKS